MMNAFTAGKLALLCFLLFAILPSSQLHACTCTFRPSSFCTSISEKDKLVLAEFVDASGPKAWYHILEGINNDLAGDTVLIYGHDGFNCLDDVYYGAVFDTVLLALEGDGPEYDLRGCGSFFAIYERDTIKDTSFPPREVYAYADFMANLKDCQQLSEFKAGTGRIVSWRDTTVGMDLFSFTINDHPLSTDASGEYSFDKIPIRTEYFGTEQAILRPGSEANPLQGVSTADLVATQQHILGLSHFTRPEQYLAADVNNSHHISVMDVVLLRRVILHIETGFPDGQSWQFIPLDYQFPDPNDPWKEEIPKVIRISYGTDLNGNLVYRQEGLDFRAVKLGDVGS